MKRYVRMLTMGLLLSMAAGAAAARYTYYAEVRNPAIDEWLGEEDAGDVLKREEERKTVLDERMSEVGRRLQIRWQVVDALLGGSIGIATAYESFAELNREGHEPVLLHEEGDPRELERRWVVLQLASNLRSLGGERFPNERIELLVNEAYWMLADTE